jgi:hypothetical protein
MCEAISRRTGVHGAIAPLSGTADSQEPIERCSERRTLYHRRRASQWFFWFFAIFGCNTRVLVDTAEAKSEELKKICDTGGRRGTMGPLVGDRRLAVVHRTSA